MRRRVYLFFLSAYDYLVDVDGTKYRSSFLPLYQSVQSGLGGDGGDVSNGRAARDVIVILHQQHHVMNK